MTATQADRSPGAVLLDELRAAVLRYVVLPSLEAADAVVLYVAATHAQPAWQHATRLVVNSPVKRCGKSRLLDVIAACSHRPLMTVNATVSAVFRSIDGDDPPTLIVDEADATFNKKSSDGTEDLRGLLNAGFGRGRPVIRCVGSSHQPEAFETFAMACLAAIGDVIPDTITDRAVTITMRRRLAGEAIAPYRCRRDEEPLHELRDRLHDWIRTDLDVLEAAQPELPVEDRAADLWEPLVAVADLAGGDWPTRARKAALVFTKQADDAAADESLTTRMLFDVREACVDLAGESVASTDLVTALRALDESPWEQLGLTARNLARWLRPYGIRPEQVRPNGFHQVRGYRIGPLADVFNRYLPPRTQAPSVTPSQVADDPYVRENAAVTHQQGVTDPTVTSAEAVTAEALAPPGISEPCDVVTDRDGPRPWVPTHDNDVGDPAERTEAEVIEAFLTEFPHSAVIDNPEVTEVDS